MIIRWIAHSCFQIVLKDRTIITDPFDGIGYEMPDIKADIVLVSHQHFDHCAVDRVGGNPLVLSESGQTVLDNIEINAFESFHDKEKGALRGKNLIFNVRAENLSVTHFGDLGHIPDDDLYEKLKGTDVLMVPVGGNYTIDAGEAFEICRALSPNIILPMHYKTPGLGVEIAPLYPFEEFVKGYYDLAHVGADYFEITAGDLKRNTRVVKLNNRYSE